MSRARRRPKRRFNQVLLARIAMPATGLAALGFVVVSLLYEPALERHFAASTGPRAADAALRRELDLLRAAWNPREHARLLAEAPGKRRFLAPLHRLLSRSDHPYLADGIDYAAAFGDPTLRPQLAEIADSGPPHIRARALLAAEKLEPWPTDTLVPLLADSTPPVQVAALQLLADRADAPWSRVVNLLDSSDPTVRDAVLAAIPQPAPDAVCDALWQRVRSSDDGRLLLTLRALERTGRAGDYQKEIVALLGRHGDDVQAACLQLLATADGPLQVGDRVWQVVRDGSAAMRLRVLAMHCLEQTGSVDVERLRSSTFTMEPLERYFAARCLLAVGDATGADLLVELLDAGQPATATASRRLLAWLTGLSPASSREAFTQAIAKMKVVDRGPLPELAVEIPAPAAGPPP